MFSTELLLVLAITIAPSQLMAYPAFTSNADLVTAVNSWCGGTPATPEATYGPIAGWDVSQITDMNSLF